jgi:hypothetical protein
MLVGSRDVAWTGGGISAETPAMQVRHLFCGRELMLHPYAFQGLQTRVSTLTRYAAPKPLH